MVNKIVKVPVGYLKVTPEKARHRTEAIHLRSGLLAGRKVVPAFGDRTRNIRMKKDFDVNKDGKIDNRDLRTGEVVGRRAQGDSLPKSGSIEVTRHLMKTRTGMTTRKGYSRRN